MGNHISLNVIFKQIICIQLETGAFFSFHFSPVAESVLLLYVDFMDCLVILASVQEYLTQLRIPLYHSWHKHLEFTLNFEIVDYKQSWHGKQCCGLNSAPSLCLVSWVMLLTSEWLTRACRLTVSLASSGILLRPVTNDRVLPPKHNVPLWSQKHIETEPRFFSLRLQVWQ